MGNRIPPEIINEILLLLLLQSVLACKLVSKEWKSLIGDSNFFKRYKDDSAAFFLNEWTLNCFFPNKDEKSYKPRRIPCRIDLYGHPKFDPVKPHLELLVDSTNKIACVKTTSGIFLLYNLFTREFRKVIDAPRRFDYYDSWSFTGFGYDPVEDDYKLIVICKSDYKYIGYKGANYKNEYGRNSNVIFTYSYNKRSNWERREGFDDSKNKCSDYDTQGFAFNGSLYWIVDGKRCIVGLNLNTYRSVEFKCPPIIHKYCLFINLTTFNGKLCCFEATKPIDGFNGFQLDVWVMEECGVAESWKRLRFSVPVIDSSINPFDSKHMKIFQDKDSGEIVVFVHDQMRYKLVRLKEESEKTEVNNKTLTQKKQKNNKTLTQKKLKNNKTLTQKKLKNKAGKQG